MSDRRTRQQGTTLVELTIAVAITATVFTALLPVFAGIRNGAEARWTGLEMVQNARVLNECLCRYLAGAGRIVSVSDRMDDKGYIEFETTDGDVYRCAAGVGGDIEFGSAGERHGGGDSERAVPPRGMLAGPVEYLRFTCYDGNDLERPTVAARRIRLVTWEAGLRSSSRLTRGRIVSGSCYLRVDAPAKGPAEGTGSDQAGCRPAPISISSAAGGRGQP
jgi:hypothetical protein